ncbi:MAG: hypothetical protein C5B54_04970 [Acidobacteria bacterium]|nr:MAG: hypothetical protein C5B54_04970 [Acidobacteriota bacterium]
MPDPKIGQKGVERLHPLRTYLASRVPHHASPLRQSIHIYYDSAMSGLPPEVGPFLSFFQLTPSSGQQSSFLELIARNHGFVLAAIQFLKNPVFEEQFLEQDSFIPAYFSMLEKGQEQVSDGLRAHLLLDFLRSTLGSNYEFRIEKDDQVKFILAGNSYNLFPFFLAHENSVLCLSKCRPGLIQYSDTQGHPSLIIDSHHLLFEQIVDCFLDKGWYRLVLKALEGLTEIRNKSLENKVYSARCFLACDYYKSKRYKEAISEFEKAMKIKSNMPQLYYNLALSHARLSDYISGIHLLNQLNRIKPGQSKTFELLGDFYTHLEQCERAMILYRKALELSDNKTAISTKMKKVEEKLPKTKVEVKKEEDEKFSIHDCLQDLTLEAELGQFQPVYGREKELLQIQEILACQSKKNVLILGDPGVGKTALIHELAYRIITGHVSSRLKNKKLIRVNMGALLAGAKFRGQFEERLMHLIRETRRLDCVLFIDDVHQIVGGGSGKPASAEASHFIKPALMNNEVQMIGATNPEEFRNGLEKDNSFLRCFQIVRLEEPDDETLMKILRAYRISLENYHRVIINEESLDTLLLWVKVLLRDRALPDKALDVLDRAAARISVQEKTAIVSSESILETISEISNVPLNRMSTSETAHYRNIENFLSGRVVGQHQAIATVSRVLCTSKLRMNLNPVRPKGIFLFVGPTGVGKTELARSMAEFLFGQQDKIIRIDMSEYMERYSASRLIGASPGYVGYYDQNQLVDKIRSNPYSLILLDEIEKADPQLLSLFLQVFDAGRLTDGKGRIAYFDNATIVMTSNIGTHLFAQNKLGYGADQDDGHVTRSDLMKEVKRFFQPEFLNRIDEIVFFKPLTIEDVRQIAAMKLSTVFLQMKTQEKELIIDDMVMSELCKIGYNYEYGARNLERILRRYLLDKMAELALSEEWPEIKSIHAEWRENEVILKAASRFGFQEILSSALEEQDFLEE